VIQNLHEQIDQLTIRVVTNLVKPKDYSRSRTSTTFKVAKIVKIPDLKTFKGTDKPSINKWTQKVKYKLRVNRDIFPNK
jgi:hypothetical protein